MPNKKLLEVVRLLSPVQAKRLRLFLQSPYHNSGYNAERLLDLCELVLRCGADEEHPDLSKAAASQRFFPDKPFREKEKNPIDSLSSELFRIVRQFLMHEDAAADMAEDREMLAVARFYLKNNMEERFEQTVAGLQKTLEASPFRDARYFLRHFEMEELVATFQGIFNTFEGDANLLAAHRDLDAFFATQKLEFACALDFQRFISQIEGSQSPSLVQTLLQDLPQSPHLQTPTTRIYAHILQMLGDAENPAMLDALEQMLAESKRQIPTEKYRNLQAYFRFFMGRRYVKMGGPDVISRFFDLNEEHLREGYFYVDDKILPTSLRLMVNIALKIGKADWAAEFLAQHPPERIVGTRYPAETHSLCSADVLFSQKKYAEAQDCLIYKMFENVNYRIMADVLMVKIHFETDELELLESRLKALDQKVRRSKLSAEGKLPYQNFLKKMERALKILWQKDPRKQAALADEIRQMPNVLQREWLLDILSRQ